MYQRIKQVADDAVKLQNKDRMDAALREISDLCATGGAMDAEQFEAAEKAQHEATKERMDALVPLMQPAPKAAAKKVAKK